MAKTIYDKIWESHLVDEQNDGTSLLYIDRHLVHEVTMADGVSCKKECSSKTT